MSKSNKYGYVGPEVTQEFKSNKGVLDIAEINNLVKQNKLTKYGQLEHIRTQTVTNDTYVEFTNLEDTYYNVHLLQLINVQPSATNFSMRLRVSNDNGLTYYAGSSYMYGAHYIDSGGSAAPSTTTTSDAFYPLVNVSQQTNHSGNGYVYFYNLLDYSKDSMITWHTTNFTGGTGINNRTWFGGGTIAQNTHNAIQLHFSTGLFDTMTASLYGIRYA